MSFFDDCDTILKVHYDHFFNGPFDEEQNLKWHQLPRFVQLCQKYLATSMYGYVQAIHYQLTTDGYLAPIGELNDLTKKVHRVTPKGFAFVLNGGYRQQIDDELEKKRLNKISATGAMMGWLVALAFGLIQAFQGCQKPATSLGNTSVVTTSKMEKPDSVTGRKNSTRLQIPRQTNDTLGHSTIQRK